MPVFEEHNAILVVVALIESDVIITELLLLDRC